jgi:microcystin-dependent protein
MPDAFYPGQTDYLHKLSEMWDLFEDAVANAVGSQGWSPSLAIVSDGTRKVLELVDWVGGEGDKPTLLGYVGATGIEPLIADGVDIRGTPGAPGIAGTGPVVGEMKMWPVATPPSLYLICDGSAVSRSTYSLLFGILGTAYGVGDGSTTFNLPDMRDKTALGASGSHAVGTSGTNDSVTIVNDNLPLLPINSNSATSVSGIVAGRNWVAAGPTGSGLAAAIWQSSAPPSNASYLMGKATPDPISLVPSHVALHYIIYSGV